jgi:membrane-associated phospholipid phosphatase
LSAALREFLLPGALVFLFLLAGAVLAVAWPMPGFLRPLGYLPSFVFFPLAALYTVALILTWQRWRQKREARWIPGRRGWKVAWQESEGGALHPKRLSRLAVASVFLFLLLNTFGCWKLAIPRWGGFGRELSVLEASRSIHGGVLAWDLLQPVLGHPFLTVLLDRVYYSWLPVFVVVVIWQVVWREPEWERRRFLLAMTLTWLGLGVVAATVAASAGPIFIDRVLPGSGHYQEMFTYLAGVNEGVGLVTLEVRELLWTTYLEGQARPYQGISAFPSIHVSVAFLYVLALWRSHPRGRWLALAYAAAVAVSSIHLGWHYAVDAYAGVIGAAGCWFLAGWWVRRRNPGLH